MALPEHAVRGAAKHHEAERTIRASDVVPRRSRPGELSSSEVVILDRVLAGESNREIGEARGTSSRTVANQVAAIFRKVGVGSRRELVARIGGLRGEAAPEPLRAPLTPRERQVAALVALGQSNKVIAHELGISASTVGVVLMRAASKLKSRPADGV